MLGSRSFRAAGHGRRAGNQSILQAVTLVRYGWVSRYIGALPSGQGRFCFGKDCEDAVAGSSTRQVA